jgi:hypothetical protein
MALGLLLDLESWTWIVVKRGTIEMRRRLEVLE